MFETFTEKHVLTDGRRSIEVHRLAGSGHNDAFAMVFLPAEGILIEGDACTPPAVTAPPPAMPNPFAVNLYENIQRLKLDVRQIAASARATPDHAGRSAHGDRPAPGSHELARLRLRPSRLRLASGSISCPRSARARRLERPVLTLDSFARLLAFQDVWQGCADRLAGNTCSRAGACLKSRPPLSPGAKLPERARSILAHQRFVVCQDRPDGPQRPGEDAKDRRVA